MTVHVRTLSADPRVRADLVALVAAAERGAPAPTTGVRLDARNDGPPGLSVVLVADAEEARRALDSGASAVLYSGASAEHLVAAARAVDAGLRVVDARVAALGAPAGEAAPALTPREREVLELLAEGLSNRDIATALSVSPHTAKFHIAALLDKLGAASRTEAVVRAARLGVLAL
jgi:two-component system nitrate/nitrite response regulator NarL